MALLFVHGVASRRNPAFDRQVASRNALFRRYIYPALNWDDHVSPFNAYWGGDAAEFRWQHESLPQDDYESFGDNWPHEDVLLAEATNGTTSFDPSAPVSALSRHSVEAALDLVWAVAAQVVDDDHEMADALAATALRASTRLAAPSSQIALTSSLNDDQWLNALADIVSASDDVSDLTDEGESFGGGTDRVWDRLGESLLRIRSAGDRIAGRGASKLLRARLHHSVSIFVGDLLAYVDQRGSINDPGPILRSVEKELEEAARQPGSLVVVAHSLGGLIVHDLLSFYRTDIRVDKFVTVGSQVGLFEELCLTQSSKSAGCRRGPSLVSRLGNVEDWINVFDRNDLLAFATQRIFAGARDFEYSTGKGVVAAHGTYFNMPSFYSRLASHLGGNSDTNGS